MPRVQSGVLQTKKIFLCFPGDGLCQEEAEYLLLASASQMTGRCVPPQPAEVTLNINLVEMLVSLESQINLSLMER